MVFMVFVDRTTHLVSASAIWPGFNRCVQSIFSDEELEPGVEHGGPVHGQPIPRRSKRRIEKGMDVKENKEALFLQMDMPRLDKQDVKISVEQNTLVVRGEGKDSDDEDGGVRRFTSILDLPPDLYKIDEIRAKMKNGVADERREGTGCSGEKGGYELQRKEGREGVGRCRSEWGFFLFFEFLNF
ncbi:heat shock 22 kDa protein, mitochondrial-like [Malus sylvestris]|uniref:heat shock 22 kDa protein, mitochondrial-like n=1 Tax=Malus sylvestris TaxID=3752 RepID=UPI0021ABE0E2|nr:heat shock 22 kDa protein, mitochondrial-like [Malus sylvestris]